MPSHTSLDEFDTTNGWRAPKASNVTMLIDMSHRSSLLCLAKGRKSVNSLLSDHRLRVEITLDPPTTCLSSDIIRRGGCRLWNSNSEIFKVSKLSSDTTFEGNIRRLSSIAKHKGSIIALFDLAN